jgi:hypothetical protein
MTLLLILTGLFGPNIGGAGDQGPFLTGFEVAAYAGDHTQGPSLTGLFGSNIGGEGNQGPFLTGFEVAAPTGDHTQGPSLTGLLR